MEISFIIVGNQEDPNGNPLGYHRTTQASKFLPASIRYQDWKGYVQKAFSKKNHYSGRTFKEELEGKPIELGKSKAYLHTMIHYASNHRPDPDNVQKGIADALFVNDKNVAGSYDFKLSKDKVGKVEVKIIIEK